MPIGGSRMKKRHKERHILRRYKVSYLRCTPDHETLHAQNAKSAKRLVQKIELGSRQFSRALGVTRKDRVQVIKVERVKR